MKAIFYLLDNCLITTNSGRLLPIHSEDWKFNIKVLESIKKYYKEGYKIIIISNQSLYISSKANAESLFIYKMEKICSAIEKNFNLKKNSIIFDYSKVEGEYRELPNKGMLYELALEYELNLAECILVGRKEFDNEVVKDTVLKFLDISDL